MTVPLLDTVQCYYNVFRDKTVTVANEYDTFTSGDNIVNGIVTFCDYFAYDASLPNSCFDNYKNGAYLW
jgi:hypothetical protein